MTVHEVKQLILRSDYDFLRSNVHLQGRIILLTLGGSYAYGTNISTSDIDIRGCCLNSPSDMLGLSHFEQVTHAQTDTTIYAFNKLVLLLLNCNPNAIEMLGCKPEHYLYLTDIGQQLIDHSGLFLSRRAVHSFGGYALSQLRRLENAIARDRVDTSIKERHILHSMENMMDSFNDRYPSYQPGDIKLYIGDSTKDDQETEIYADLHLLHYPVRDFIAITGELGNVIKDYNTLGKRNHKKDDAHLNKHAMHLVRLYMTGIDILERQAIITYREQEHDLLMRIRNGAFQKGNGSYDEAFFDLLRDMQNRFAYAKENTTLPEKPDIKKVEAFMMAVNRRAIA